MPQNPTDKPVAKPVQPQPFAPATPQDVQPQPAKRESGDVQVYVVRDSIVQFKPGGLYDEKNVASRDERVTADQFPDAAWFQRLLDSGGLQLAEKVDRETWEKEQADKAGK